jgi:hypothetical protein
LFAKKKKGIFLSLDIDVGETDTHTRPISGCSQLGTEPKAKRSGLAPTKNSMADARGHYTLAI